MGDMEESVDLGLTSADSPVQQEDVATSQLDEWIAADPVKRAHHRHNEEIERIGQQQEAEAMQHHADAGEGEIGAPAAGGDAREDFTVHVATWNVGNEMPPPNLHPWVPSGGGGADIVVVCGQEATYEVSSQDRERPVGRLCGAILGAEGLVGAVVAPNPYCKLCMNGRSKTKESVRTWVESGTTSPAWEHEGKPVQFDLYVEKKKKVVPSPGDRLPWLDVFMTTEELEVQILDSGVLSDTILGVGRIPLQLADLHIAEAAQPRAPDGDALEAAYGPDGAEVTVPLKTPDGADGGAVRLRLTYESVMSVEQIRESERQKFALKKAQENAVLRNKAARDGTLSVKVIKATDLMAADLDMTSDPYCVLRCLDDQDIVLKSKKTRTVHKNLHPVWNETLSFDIRERVSAIQVCVMDWDRIHKGSDDPLGFSYLPIEYLAQYAQPTKVTHNLTSTTGERIGRVHLEIHFQHGVHRKKDNRSCLCCAQPTREPSAPVYVEPESTDPFFSTVHKTVGSLYEVVGKGIAAAATLKGELGQMRLVVLVNTEATGLGGFVSNKGGIAAKFVLNGSSFCVVCSHLAAHEGIGHCRKRNEDASEIQRGARVGSQQCDLGNQFDHVIWAGDLNYRQERREWWSTQEQYDAGTKASTSHEEKLDQVKRAVAEKDWEQLRDNDELCREMAAGNVFAGFTDAIQWKQDITERGLLPTFKMQRGRRYAYFSQRVPSFTDRILWRSAPGAAQCMKLQTFASAPALVTSDHKPVFARFKVSVPATWQQEQDHFLQAHPPVLNHPTYAVIRLTDVVIENLTSSVPEGDSLRLQFRSPDPYNPIFQGEVARSNVSLSTNCTLDSESNKWIANDAQLILRTVAPSAEMLSSKMGPTGQHVHTESMVLAVTKAPKLLGVLEPAPSDAALDVWDSLDKEALRAGRFRVARGGSMITESIHGAINSVGARQEIGFGRLALQPVAMAEQAVGASTSFPKGFDKSDWLRPGEQLVAPPSPSAPHYSSREWSAALSLNGIGAPGARVRGRMEVFDVVRVI